MTIPYYLVDVFAENRLEGNQLAVFRHAGNLSTTMMQAIAKETNLAETTFITAENGLEFDVRIFTTEYEMPFAGHPTVGTAAVIKKHILTEDVNSIVLNLKIGPIKVEFLDEIVQFSIQKGSISQSFSAESVANLLEISVEEIDDLPIQVSSTGFPFLMIPLKNIETLTGINPNSNRFKDFLIEHKVHKSNSEDGLTIGQFCFCRKALNPSNDLHSRMFLLQENTVFEDPATGSAHTALGNYLLENQVFGTDFKLKSEQGFEIGRPSILHISGNKTDGVNTITLGGKVQFIAKGDWEV
jgi:trans-2,3-dihydro-3-hydroxyanthranilate isomerase